MVTSIGSATLAQASPAAIEKTQARGATPAAGTAAAQDPIVDSPASAETRSALSDATARLGEQLDAQADASRVDRARAEAATPPDDAAPPAADADAAAEGKAIATSGGARPAGGSAGTTGETESADYIAEADTNSDKKVSDQERIAYEKKLEQQARDKTGALQKTYGLGETGEPAVNASA